MVDVFEPYVFRATDAYEAYVGRWSRPLAEAFLAWFAAPAAGRWLDVGCGTGALTEAVLDATDPIAVVGIDPSPEFLGDAQRRIADPRARFEVGDARALPVMSDDYDAVVAGLVLHFIPDPAPAVAEMVRAARPGGAVGAYVWDYHGQMQRAQYFWDAVAVTDAAAASPRSASALPHLRARADGGPVSRGRTGRRGGRARSTCRWRFGTSTSSGCRTPWPVRPSRSATCRDSTTTGRPRSGSSYGPRSPLPLMARCT